MIDVVSELDSLPEAIKENLDCCNERRAGRPGRRYKAIIETMHECGGSATRDQIIVGVYKKTGLVVTRQQLWNALSVLRQKGALVGTHNDLNLIPESTYVQEQLSHKPAMPRRSERETQGKPETGRKGDEKATRNKVPDNPNPVPPPKTGLTIICANCTAEKTYDKASDVVRLDNIDFCSNLCRKEFRECLDDGDDQP